MGWPWHILRRRAPSSALEQGGRSGCCVLLVCLVLVAGIMLRLDCKLRPAILEIALSDLETVVNNTIDQVCIQDAADGEITYSKLVQLQYDQHRHRCRRAGHGSVATLSGNVQAGSRIKRQAIDQLVNRLGQVDPEAPRASAPGHPHRPDASLSGPRPRHPGAGLQTGGHATGQPESSSYFRRQVRTRLRHQIQPGASPSRWCYLAIPGGTD